MREAYIYVISMAESDFVKVGHAADPRERLSALQTNTPFQLKLEASIKVISTLAVQIEKGSHRRLRALGECRREWFSVPVSTAVRVIEEEVAAAGTSVRVQQMPPYGGTVKLQLTETVYAAVVSLEERIDSVLRTVGHPSSHMTSKAKILMAAIEKGLPIIEEEWSEIEGEDKPVFDFSLPDRRRSNRYPFPRLASK